MTYISHSNEAEVEADNQSSIATFSDRSQAATKIHLSNPESHLKKPHLAWQTYSVLLIIRRVNGAHLQQGQQLEAMPLHAQGLPLHLLQLSCSSRLLLPPITACTIQSVARLTMPEATHATITALVSLETPPLAACNGHCFQLWRGPKGASVTHMPWKYTQSQTAAPCYTALQYDAVTVRCTADTSCAQALAGSQQSFECMQWVFCGCNSTAPRRTCNMHTSSTDFSHSHHELDQPQVRSEVDPLAAVLLSLQLLQQQAGNAQLQGGPFAASTAHALA